MTGFSPSVVRAGIMLIITGILYLLSYSSDSITSLFIAVAIILIFTPHAALDLSLWLSAFATLGVIVFSEYRKTLVNSEENQSFTKRFYTALRDGIVVSVFAFSATFAISVFNFKTFSIISIFSTLIFALLVEVLIYLGLLALAVGWFVNLNAPLIFISDFIKILAECLSDIKFAYVSADSLAATILLYAFSALFFIFLVIETKKKKLCLI